MYKNPHKMIKRAENGRMTDLSPSFFDSWSLANLNNLCNWATITCTTAGSVYEIDLSYKQLSGTLASFGFTSFPNLNSFMIKDNYFTGPIPRDIKN